MEQFDFYAFLIDLVSDGKKSRKAKDALDWFRAERQKIAEDEEKKLNAAIRAAEGKVLAAEGLVNAARQSEEQARVHTATMIADAQKVQAQAGALMESAKERAAKAELLMEDANKRDRETKRVAAELEAQKARVLKDRLDLDARIKRFSEAVA